MALAAGVFAAGVVQLAFMLPFMAPIRSCPCPPGAGRHPGVRKILKLMVPGLFGSSVAQISFLLDTLIASFLVTGSISWLYFSDRMMEFPLGVFGIALATVLLPSLSGSTPRRRRRTSAGPSTGPCRLVHPHRHPGHARTDAAGRPDAGHPVLGGEFDGTGRDEVLTYSLVATQRPDGLHDG